MIKNKLKEKYNEFADDLFSKDIINFETYSELKT